MMAAVWVWCDLIFSAGTWWWCNIPQSNCHWHGATAEECKQVTASAQVWYEISSSAVLTDLREKADEATCIGLAGIVLRRRWEGLGWGGSDVARVNVCGLRVVGRPRRETLHLILHPLKHASGRAWAPAQDGGLYPGCSHISGIVTLHWWLPEEERPFGLISRMCVSKNREQELT